MSAKLRSGRGCVLRPNVDFVGLQVKSAKERTLILGRERELFEILVY